MQILIGIIPEMYVNTVIDDLLKEEVSVTEIASTGGFLKEGSRTILIGVEEEMREQIDRVFKRNITALRGDEDPKAHFFVLDVEQDFQI